MEYPVWHFTGISSGLLIAVVSVLHVFIAQFAVGGGIHLVWTEYRARRQHMPELLLWLERHTRFFLLVTMVFGALSGVGIWFSISAVNPGATSFLIHNFVFFWAAEWLFFLLEVVSLLAYCSTCRLTREGSMPPETHRRIGLIYAAAGVISLVLINGIITFMLTPGQGPSSGDVWDAFFNPTFLPSLVFRLALSLMLAGMFALFTASRIRDEAVRRLAIRSGAQWIIFPFFLLLAGSAWYFAALPPDRQDAILRCTSDIHPFVKTYGWILPAVFLGGVLAFVKSDHLRRPLTVLILCAGLMLTGSFEWIRETGRRPWIVEGVIYSNGVSVAQAERAGSEGAASVSGWLRAFDDMTGAGSDTAPPAQVIRLNGSLTRGALLFAQQCNTCHGLGGPRIDILPLTARLTPEGLAAQLQGQGKHLEYMPPFAGSQADRDALVVYLKQAEASHRPGPIPGAEYFKPRTSPSAD